MNRSGQKESFFEVQFRHVRQCAKEARLVIVIWLIGLIYCTTVIVTMGYIPPEERPETPNLVWGMPAWVFWGLFLPWFVQIGLTWWFALFFFKDDEPYMEFPDSQGSQQTESAEAFGQSTSEVRSDSD